MGLDNHPGEACATQPNIASNDDDKQDGGIPNGNAEHDRAADDAPLHRRRQPEQEGSRVSRSSSDKQRDATDRSEVPTYNETVDEFRKYLHEGHRPEDDYEPTPWLMYYTTVFSYFVLYIFGVFRDFLRSVGLEKVTSQIEKNREGYPPLYKSFDAFYTRNIYRPIRDCWNLPLLSVPGAMITLRDRTSDNYNWTFRYLDTETTYINLGSYNYLGFAENKGDCADQVQQCLVESGYSLCSTRHELGTHELHVELENLLAEFLGVDAAIVVGMGFATNSTNIPTLVGPGCLIISDELNHASLCLGCKLSGATIRKFKHNDMGRLEKVSTEGGIRCTYSYYVVRHYKKKQQNKKLATSFVHEVLRKEGNKTQMHGVKHASGILYNTM